MQPDLLDTKPKGYEFDLSNTKDVELKGVQTWEREKAGPFTIGEAIKIANEKFSSVMNTAGDGSNVIQYTTNGANDIGLSIPIFRLFVQYAVSVLAKNNNKEEGQKKADDLMNQVIATMDKGSTRALGLEASTKPTQSVPTVSSHAEQPTPVSDSETPKFGFLEYDSNSCYIDSLLMSIMHVPDNAIWEIIRNSTIKDEITEEQKGIAKKIKGQLELIYNFIQKPSQQQHDKDLVRTLRNQLGQWDPQYNIRQMDPDELLTTLGGMLVFKQNTNIFIPYEGSESTSFFGDNFTKMSPHGINEIDGLTKDFDDKGHRTNSGIWFAKRIISSTGFIVRVDRKSSKSSSDSGSYDTKDDTQIDIEEDVKDATGNEFKLSSIIIHDGGGASGHYTCYFKNKGKWYLFNDNATTFKQQTDDFFTNEHIRQNVTQLVYLPPNKM